MGDVPVCGCSIIIGEQGSYNVHATCSLPDDHDGPHRDEREGLSLGPPQEVPYAITWDDPPPPPPCKHRWRGWFRLRKDGGALDHRRCELCGAIEYPHVPNTAEPNDH